MVQNDFFCKIYVDDDEIYSGDLSEIPEKFRARIIGDISEWADSLGKSGVNELLYSHLVWYHKKGSYCSSCEVINEDSEIEQCETCSAQLTEQYIYERSEQIDKILTCIGMISRIEVITTNTEGQS